MIGVLDYGVGNVGAFLRIFHGQNIPAMPIKVSSDFKSVDKLILPGVGAFDSAMSHLNNSGLRGELDKLVLEKKIPLLAVCIGMHMLGNSSEEGLSEGLGYIEGHTVKMPMYVNDSKVLLPHMGWNDINKKDDDAIWKDVNVREGFYFLHSYEFVPESKESEIGTSEYEHIFACEVRLSNVYGFQFHPEKSLQNGINLLTNFASLK